MYTVEPVFGNIKFNLGYRHFILRNINKVKGEFNLMCIAHNLNKINLFLKKSGTNLTIALLKIEKIVKNTIKIMKNKENISYY